MQFRSLTLCAAGVVLVGCGGQEVSGTVRWGDGRPAAGVKLMFVAPGDEITEETTGRDGRFQAVIPPETYGLVALSQGAASDPVGIEHASQVVLELRPPPQALTVTCSGGTFGVSRIRDGGDVEIQYRGTLDYLLVPYWLMNLRWASRKLDPAERGPLYAPDPNAWQKRIIAEDRSGTKTLLLLVPRRYQAFSRHFHEIELSRSIYVCAR